MQKYLALVLLAGCGEVPCFNSFYTAGMLVCYDHPSQQESEQVSAQVIEDLVQITEEETQVWFPEVKNLTDVLASHYVELTFTHALMGFNCSAYYGNTQITQCERRIEGFNNNGTAIVVRYEDCKANYIIGHELLHSVEAFWLGGMTDHITPDLWEKGKVMTQIKKRSDALCAAEQE